MPSTPPVPPVAIAHGTGAYRNLSVALLMAGFGTFALLYAPQPLLPLFTRDFGIDAAGASLAVSLATLPMALMLLPAGLLSDRIGRRPVMAGSLGAAAALTLASALAPGWHAYLALRVASGIALSGIPAVAMAYVAEEVDAATIGRAMGLYIAGSAIGGMCGRVGVSVIADLAGWRWAMGVVGAAGAAAAAAFARRAPPSRLFTSRRYDLGSLGDSVARLFADPALRLLYAEAFLLMGIFVSIYNYLGFRLLAPPFRLGQSAVGAVFLLYIVGSFASSLMGRLGGRFGRRTVFWMPVAALLPGIGLTLPGRLFSVVAGVGVVTAAFFGAHSIASSWVGRRAGTDRGLAASFYLLSYYPGSSLLGSASGLAWSAAGWPGVAAFCAVGALLALAASLRLRGIPPRAGGAPEPSRSLAGQ